MVVFINAITLIWLAAWTYYAARCLAKGQRHSILFVIIVHSIFCGAPLLADLLVGQPEYARYPGFYDASRDTLTSIIYCFYISSCVLIWWLLGIGHPPKMNADTILASRSPILHVLAHFFMVLPLIAVMLAPDPSIYACYGAVLDQSMQGGATPLNGHVYVANACQLALVGAVFLLLSPMRKNLPLILATLVMIAWLSGKRNMLALEFLVLFYVAWREGYLRGVYVLAAGCCAAVLFGMISYVYQQNMRSIAINEVTSEAFYENLRIDYGRDDVIKQAIYCELRPDEGPILEYRGQSLTFYPAMFIPRSIWPEKPWPYAVYVTARMLQIPPRSLGWVMTTSVLEEALANFGWLGMLMGPMLIAAICRIGDSCGNRFIQAITVISTCLLLAVHLAAFWSIMVMWVGMVIWTRARASFVPSCRVVPGIYPGRLIS